MTEAEFKGEVAAIRPKLLAIANRHLTDGNEAEDIVQDTMLRLWQLHDEIHSPIMPLASVLTRNLSIDHIRRFRKQTSIEFLQLAGEEADDGHERIQHMMMIVNSLPGLQQTILRLRHMEGMEFSDIAQITGSTEAAIRQALSRARKSVLKKYENENGRD